MKKLLNISIVAALAVSPMLAFADPTPTCQGVDSCTDTTLTGNGSAAPYALSADASNDGTNVVTASYVKGAYNDLTRKINTVAANAALDAAGKITAAAGNGLVVNGTALDVNVASAGGLAITGDALNVVTDGTTIVKDGTNGTLSVGAIAESQVTGLQTDLGNKQGILTNDDTEAQDRSINQSVKTAVATTGASDNYLVTEAAVRDAIDSATSTLSGKQDQLKYDDNGTLTNINTTVVEAIGPATGTGAASNANLATEKAVRTAVDAVASQAMTLTNKTIDFDNNTVSNIETDNFKSGVIVASTTGIAAATADASDTALPTEKAVRSAITSATDGMVTTTTLNNNSLPVNASTLKVGGKDVATQSAVVNTIGTSTVTIPVLATWGGSTTTNGSTLTINAASYAEPTVTP